MRLHWSPRSPFVRKVMIVLHEKRLLGKVELMRNPVAMNAPNAVVMADNPLGQIPTLILDDGSVLHDSRVICEYLDGIGDPPGLLPAAGPERFRTLVWQSLADGVLDTVVIWRQWATDRGRDPLDASDSYQAAFALKVGRSLDRFEESAAELGGASFGLGHVAVGTMLSYLDFRWRVLDWRHGRPALAAWHESFEARPSVIATRIADDGVAAGGKA